MSKRSSEREQLSLFRALPGGDMQLRDAQDLMAYPFFSLAKSPRTVPIGFEAGGVSLTVEGVPEYGIATIWDADVLMEVTRARAVVAQTTGSASDEAARAGQPAENRLPGSEPRPGKVIALLNQKGGEGKTTLATHLAGELAMQGRRVTLLDADPQGSALDWAQRWLQSGQERLYGVFGLARDSLHQEAPQIALQAGYVVIDGPPRIAALARSALLAADLVLIPVQPSACDVWASHEMVQLVIEAKVFRPALRAAFVINRRVVGTVIGREARAALADQPFAALHAEISQRIVFADSVATGRFACEAAPKCAAAREIAALAQAVREMLR